MVSAWSGVSCQFGPILPVESNPLLDIPILILQVSLVICPSRSMLDGRPVLMPSFVAMTCRPGGTSTVTVCPLPIAATSWPSIKM
jgi:hypothetical protein